MIIKAGRQKKRLTLISSAGGMWGACTFSCNKSVKLMCEYKRQLFLTLRLHTINVFASTFKWKDLYGPPHQQMTSWPTVSLLRLSLGTVMLENAVTKLLLLFTLVLIGIISVRCPPYQSSTVSTCPQSPEEVKSCRISDNTCVVYYRCVRALRATHFIKTKLGFKD